ncbi:CYT protein, partial [Odontophorus gujanensis]|nr:CYT protein [Odontophorus gujanensis]
VAMAGARCLVVLLAAALMLAGAVLGSGERSRLLGAPVPVSENDEGVQRALQFAMAEYNRASNDKYSSRLVRVISVKRQLVSGIKYVLEVEIGRTTCPKSSADLQNCEFHEEPEMAKHTTCTFVVYNVPWLNEIKLLKSNCQ